MDDTAPALSDILKTTSFDVHWILVLAAAGALYGMAVRRANHGLPRIRFLRLRLVAFGLGLGAFWFAAQGPLEHYGNQFIWANFSAFLVITMIAAPLLVLSTPLTLAFRVSDTTTRARLRRIYQGFPVSWLVFPPVAWLTFAVVTYLWQFSSLTTLAAQNSLVRDIQMLSLLLVGVLFWYPAFAVDPIRWRIGYPLRGLYVVLEMAHKGLFGGMFLSLQTPFHSYFAENLPSWGPSAMEDQRLGILILWLGGHLIFIIALIAIAAAWVRYEARNSRRLDRRLAAERERERRHRAALEQVFHKPI